MGRRSTNIEFIERARKIHRDKYDYSLVNYIGIDCKVKIICPLHGEFLQTPHTHLIGQGCSKCVGKYKLNSEEYINEANKIHNNRYDYSLLDYKKGQGCPKCVGRYKSTIEFINEANKIHNNEYDYSLVNYKKVMDKINIICHEHGEFSQEAHYHLNGQGCPKCGGTQKSNTNEFIKNSKKIHYNKYDYSKTEYLNNRTKVIIICPIHWEFSQTPKSHLIGQGCPICKQSKGELKINQFLNINGIEYVPQKTFEDCKNERSLYYDFYLPNHNTLIEYDGKQHFKIVKYFGGEKGFKIRQKRDKIKENFCKINNINLMRIKYNENIEDKLKIFL